VSERAESGSGVSRTPEEARIQKLEERNEDLHGVLEEVAGDLEEAIDVNVTPRAQVRDALQKLKPYRREDDDA